MRTPAEQPAEASLDAIRAADTVAAAAEAAVDHLVGRGLAMPSVYVRFGARLRCLAVRGYWQVLDGIPAGAGVLGRCIESGKACIVPDVAADGSFVAAVPGIVAEVCIPMRYEGEVFGALNVESPASLAEPDIDEVRRCARLLEERVAALGGPPGPSRWHELARRAAELNGAWEPGRIAELAATAAREITAMSSAMVVLVEGDDYVPVAVSGPLAATLRGIAPAGLSSIAGWTTAAASVYTFGDTTDQGFFGQEYVRSAGVQALFAVALTSPQGPVGFLLAAHDRPVRPSSEEVELLELLGAHVTSALQTAATLVELRGQAARDALTGLGHNAAFRARLAADRRSMDPGQRLAVLLIDIDGFKQVNETRGHAAGDEILTGVAGLLERTLRESDRVFRIGGDEFAGVLHVHHEEEALRIAQRLCEAAGDDGRVTVSVGLAVDDEAGEPASTEELLGDAGLALYEAKRQGRGHVVPYRPKLRTVVLQRARLAAELSSAVERNEFHLVYQPVVGLDSGTIVGVEALVRWRHPRMEQVGPDRFVPIAEEDGQIVVIGDWVLEGACRQLAAWNAARQSQPPLRMGVNVSAAQLTPSFAHKVRRVLRETGVPPAQLMLEMTESVFVDDAKQMDVLHSLRELGVVIGIDDFGTGYSSLSYLRDLPIDVLKIDRSFIADITEARNTALARAILDLSRTLDLVTVAEGIERSDQMACLRELGCEFGQGYLFARPADPELLTPSLLALSGPVSL